MNVKIIAKQLITHSLNLRSGDTLFCDFKLNSKNKLIREFIKQCKLINIEIYFQNTDICDLIKSNKYININILNNPKKSTFNNINIDLICEYQNIIHAKSKWVFIKYPEDNFIEKFGDSKDLMKTNFENACCVNPQKLLDFALPLQELMNKTKIVHIISKSGTDIEFSIENIPSFICTGEHNMPGGEVFTSPIVNSINGRVVFNTETIHPILKKRFKNIVLEFQNGELIYAHSEVNNELLLQTLKIAPNASKIGEFAMGINPFIKRSFNLSAFDEKMLGSFHLALGDSYPILNEKCNTSKTHWDLVQILTPEYGGGEIYFDGILIQKDGRFIPKQLEQLTI